MRVPLPALVTAVTFSVLFVNTPLAAQDHPDLSGSWALADLEGGPQGGPPGGGPGGGGGGMGMFSGFGQQATITQDGATLTVVRTAPMGTIESVYHLDGSESTNQFTGMGGNTIELVSMAAWDDGNLVITTPLSFGGNSFESQVTVTLEGSDVLVVETVTVGGQGGGPGPIRATYHRED